jgi:hypothetical protein
MANLRVTLSAVSLAAAASVAFSCGVNNPPKHVLETITLNPSIADAQNYPNGQVQFVATGNYMTPPTVVTPLTATWGACNQFQTTTAVTVGSNGLAQCSAGASGTYMVWANVPLDIPGVANCTAENACGGGCVVQGNALLTCP